MEKLDEKIDKLINALEKNENVKEIKRLNKIIKEDKELRKLLEEYQNTSNDELKRKILSNENFQEYKKYETEINLLIMYMNNKLKEISDRNGCL